MTEFSFVIHTDDIKDTSRTYTFQANEEQRDALAKRYDVLGVDALEAEIEVNRQQGFLIIAKGQFNAKITQRCVVTLEPVQTKITDECEGFFTDRDDTVSFAKARHKHIQENQDPETSFLDESDDPEIASDGQIDLGELVAQFLSLSIPAYPHKEGVEFEKGDEQVSKTSGSEAPHKHNPFAALEALKKKDS